MLRHRMSEKSSLTDRPVLPILDEMTMRAAARDIFAAARSIAESIASVPLGEISSATVLDEWDRMGMILEDILGPVSILGSVHPSRQVRSAADEVLLDATRFTSELFQNAELYERIRRVPAESVAQQQLRKDLLESFEDSGVSLPEERRRRVREIFERIEELSQEFDRNIRENETRLRFTPEEYEGLPDGWLQGREKDADGAISVGFDSPDYVPFMANSVNAAARRRYYIAYTNRGTERNLELLDQIVALRRELAGLYGLPSYAAYVTRRHMVENPATVERFLGEVAEAITVAEEGDLDELRKLRAELERIPLEEARIDRWDSSFYSEQLRRKRFALDQETLRRHFPTFETVEWALSISGRLYGVDFRRRQVPVWHEDVAFYDVCEAASGDYVGGIYLDLFPREGKYKHAAAWPVRGVSRRTGRTPISVLVCNFERRGLTHGEVETLFHEFGHVLHGVLSNTWYNAHSGTSVVRDFVEAPSQMYEEWARRIESLATLSQIAPAVPPIDEALVERLAASRRFGRGINYARQHLYASLDMALASAEPGSALEVWKQLEAGTPMGHLPGTAFPGTFGHIAADYAAGYYGYMWSEVLALDMLSAFGENIMDPAVGRRFRETILARGGEVPAKRLVSDFLGREVSSEAFYAEITGKR
jgi:thimet oligopeptidase